MVYLPVKAEWWPRSGYRTPCLNRCPVSDGEVFRKRCKREKPNAFVFMTQNGIKVTLSLAAISHDEYVFSWNNFEQVGIKQGPDGDGDMQLFKNLASKTLHSGFTDFDAPARQFPFAPFIQQ